LPELAAGFADGGLEGLQYTIVQAERDIGLQVFIKSFGFTDVLLVDLHGNVVYTATQGKDLGTNLRTGPYRESALAQAVVAGLNDTRFIDFAPYAPIGEPAAFLVTPILDSQLNPAGTAVFRIGVGMFNEIMHARTGLGESGETYLVGADRLMRSDSILDPEHHSMRASFLDPDAGRVTADSVQRALEGDTGAALSSDYDGRAVLAAYAPLKFGDVTWAMVAQIDRAEAFAAVRHQDLVLLGLGAVGVVVLLALVPFLSHSVTDSVAGPIRRVIAGLTAVAGEVAAASSEIASSSQALAASTSDQASNLARSTATLDALAKSTQDTARHSQEADRHSQQSRSEVLRAGKAMGELVQAIREIKAASDQTVQIIKTINEIAFQTNLLSLNAAVEAARAGDVGRGFAVVAEEVRNLANRSAQAAQNTADLLEEARRKSDTGVAAADDVERMLVEIESSNERVGGLIGEVVKHSEQQAGGIAEVAQAVSAIDTRTQDDAAVAQQTASASQQLSTHARSLLDFTGQLTGIAGLDRQRGKKSQQEPQPASGAVRALPAGSAPGRAASDRARATGAATRKTATAAARTRKRNGAAPAPERRTSLRESIAWAEKQPDNLVSPEFADLRDSDFRDI
jgi:methyl-accepting chemotaxis protein